MAQYGPLPPLVPPPPRPDFAPARAPGFSTRIVVPAQTEAERTQRMTDQLAARDSAERHAAEINATAESYKQQAIAARRAKTEAAKAKLLSDPGAQADTQSAQGAAMTGDAIGALSAGRNVTVKRPQYGPTKRFTDTMLGTPQQTGKLDEYKALQQQYDDTRVAQERTTADALAEAANRQGVALEALRNNEMRQAQRQQEQIERIQRATDLSAQAADKFAKMQDVDPGRYWRNASAFQKFAAALGAALLGWAGRTDATAHITNAIATDIEAQKAAIAKASQTVSDSRARAQQEESLYGQILAQTGSEREADLIYTDALMSHAKSQMMAKLANAGVQTLNDQQRLAFNELEQKHAAIKQQLEVTAATNAPTRSVFVPAIRDPLARKLVYKEGELGQDIRKQASGKAIDVAAQREENAAKIAAAQAKGQGGSEGERRLQVTSAYRLASDTATDQGVIDQATDFEKRYANDIPGFPTIGGSMFAVHGLTHEQKSAYYDLVNIITRSLRPETGAAYTAQEIDNASGGIINEGRSKEDNAALQQAASLVMGANEDDVWHILGEIKTKHQRRIEHLQRPLSSAGILDDAGIAGEVAPRAAETVSKPSGVRLRGQ